MSLPDEQAHAVIEAEKLLRELSAMGRGAFQHRAAEVLRHFPTPAEWADLLTATLAYNEFQTRRQAMRDEFAAESARRRPLRVLDGKPRRKR